MLQLQKIRMGEIGRIILVFIILNVNFNTISSEESEESDEYAYPNHAYSQIFKSVPALFEYLLNALEENPEMLEKNNINLFKRTAAIKKSKNNADDKNKENNEGDEETRLKRCDREVTKYKRNINNDHSIIDKATNNINNVREIRANNKNPPSTAAYEYGNLLLRSDDEENDDIEIKREINDDGKTNDQLNEVKELEREKQEREVKNDVKISKMYSRFSDPNHNEYQEVIWDNSDGYPGFQRFFGLDLKPEEIEKGFLMTEELLEEYNRNRK